MELTDTGNVVYERTYSRTKPDGKKENWAETVERVVDGNIALLEDPKLVPGEREALIDLMTDFKIVPAGRHLWASGVQGAIHLNNCWTSGWTERPSDHFEFTFMRLMEGGGVGANYSKIPNYGLLNDFLQVHIVCDPDHPDYQVMKDAGLLSEAYAYDWVGSFEVGDSREGWAEAVVDLIDTYYREDVGHLFRVYDVSRVRPSGAKLKTFGGTASGPAPLAKALKSISRTFNDNRELTGMAAMDIDHALAECVVSGGVRRSARMAMMHWADSEIFDFIDCKKSGISHWSTNISVVVDEEFWAGVRCGNESQGTIAVQDHANEVLERIAQGMLQNGEPGFWDISLSSEGEPGEMYATNPCGEITLEEWEPCNLGHVNLAAFVDPDTGDVDNGDVDEAHALMTRFLIRATFAPVTDPKSREVIDRNRRIGVGHLGVASFLAMTGVPYSEADASGFDLDLAEWGRAVDDAALRYSHELRIPVPVKNKTVAPTGTIAKMPGVSEGVHPIFSKYFLRRIRFSAVDPAQMDQVEEFRRNGYSVVDDIYAANTVVVEIPTKDILVEAVERLGYHESVVQGADELTLDEMLGFQAMYQTCWADNAVSYTANIPAEEYSVERLRDLIIGYSGVLKGATVFPEATMALSPYERLTKEQYEFSLVQETGDGVDEDCASGACPVR